MKIDTAIRHVTKPGANLFLELGFSPDEAKRLQTACQGGLYPRPDRPVKFQPPVLYQLGDFPTRDDTDAENPVGANLQDFALPRLQTVGLGNPPNPVGYPARSPEGVPIVGRDGFKRVAVLKDRMSKTPVRGRRRLSTLRDHQHRDALAGIERQTLQKEIAVFADGCLSPVCLHALSVVDPDGRGARACPSRSCAPR